MKKKIKIEFSKKIVIGVSIYLAILNLFAFVVIIITGDVSPLAYIIPAGFSLGATCFGFYFWKAKAENRIKLCKENKIPMEKPKDVFTDGNENDYSGYYSESEDLSNG